MIVKSVKDDIPNIKVNTHTKNKNTQSKQILHFSVMYYYTNLIKKSENVN